MQRFSSRHEFGTWIKEQDIRDPDMIEHLDGNSWIRETLNFILVNPTLEQPV